MIKIMIHPKHQQWKGKCTSRLIRPTDPRPENVRKNEQGFRLISRKRQADRQTDRQDAGEEERVEEYP